MRHVEFEYVSADEPLDIELPEQWISFILDTCGGSINQSGLYRLPGAIWEWVVLKLAGDEQGARHVERGVWRIVRRFYGCEAGQ